ncbi:cystathionine gamma-synthase family protein [Paenalcaligenes niemegkensis]|uniref:cystathionine gamma-synthase family protein n=1 Tax=Paenalcaligenes niemegkensis TaxID=2895469 RepID=UPI001EE78F3C|nr:cystathionine gamma-synthase family protein [Paenalcaligenes niemegkensis]MCQ9616105.1 cystathionine gamma-synthase family protein [Paenalcaligenes niemegkensis]
MSKNGFTTEILHSDRRTGCEFGAVHQPLHPSAEYAFADARELAAVFQGKPGFSYSRQGTPTTAALEKKLTHMEQGIGSVSFATGMAALSATFFTLLKAGDHLICSKYIFGNTNSLLGTLQGLGVEITLVDATDVEAVKQAKRSNTIMVFTETIANPGTQIADLEAIGEWCKTEGLLYVVDNTLSTPWLSPARLFGAGLAVNSLSKHIAGHGNALGGMVTDTGLFDWSRYPNISSAYQQGNAKGWGLTQIKKKGLRDMGGTLSSDAAHRVATGMETLPLRMAKACDNACQLAHYLAGHPSVTTVLYPGLSSHPQHRRATSLFNGRYGTLMGVELAADIDVFDFLNKLKVVVLSTHLGDTRSLTLPVAHTIYYEMGAEQRALMGIGDNLLRISIGIEDYADLEGDFAQALEA